MASITFTNPNFNTLTAKRPSYPPYYHHHSFYKTTNNNNFHWCRCHNNNDSSSSHLPRWDSAVRNALKNAIKRFDSFVNSRGEVVKSEGGDGDGEWDWERWKKHFDDVDEQQRLVNILKSQLDSAVLREDYKEAATLKVALAAAAANDIVGRSIYCLNRAVEEERYEDAAFIRDNASAGLVGWWAGISTDSDDPYGRIIRITAEHGRYIARAFSPRQLAADAFGPPLFEIYLTVNQKGEYKQQAVYLKRGEPNDLGQDSRKVPSKTSQLNSLDLTEDKTGLPIATNEISDSAIIGDDGDGVEGLSEFQNILSDMIPGFRVKVLKVTTSGKLDRDQISKVIKQIMEEEEDVNNLELEIEDENIDETDEETDDIEMNASDELFENDRPKEITVEVVIDSVLQKPSSSSPANKLLRLPAKLEKNGNMSFSFSVKQEDKGEHIDSKDKASVNRKDKLKGQRAIEGLVFNVAKSVSREKIPLKVLKEIGDLIDLTMSQARKGEPLSGSTTFNRIVIPTSTDPLNGLYFGTRGLYTSEVIQLRRRYGQWQEDGVSEDSSKLDFYEYVEAFRLTGDPSVPAGEVTFRAKVGKGYQLPHRGMIPGELGVIARYKGQGRLAEPGFPKPRWVDGELVILDGKFIKEGPVVGFVYLVPGNHFMIFFNRLTLQQ